jgi:hypothetical protein
VLFEGRCHEVQDLFGAVANLVDLICDAAADEPYVERLFDMMNQLILEEIEILTDLGADVIYRSGIYETTNFWTPEMVRKLFLPRVKAQADMAHRGGSKYHTYTVTGIMPIFMDYPGAGVDVLSSLDPVYPGDSDLLTIKEGIGNRICLWGGVNPTKVIDHGTVDEVKNGVLTAIAACAPGGGFVLSTAGSPQEPSAYENVMAFIRYGREYGRYPLGREVLAKRDELSGG